MLHNPIKPKKQLDPKVIFCDFIGVHPVLDIIVVFFRHDEKEVETEFEEWAFDWGPWVLVRN
jgi:hypothetical protein